jgi:hypothetical protein
MDDVKSVGGAAAKAVGEVAAKVVKEVAGAAVAAVGEKLGGSPAPLPLPEDRAQLLVLHREARRRRDAAALMSDERADASHELERIEIQIARVERAMDPPLV